MVEQHEVIGVTLEDLNFMPRIDNMACIADFKVLFLTRPVTLSSPHGGGHSRLGGGVMRTGKNGSLRGPIRPEVFPYAISRPDQRITSQIESKAHVDLN